MTPLTVLEISLGVEYVDDAYPCGDPLRYGKDWDEHAKEMAKTVKSLLGEGTQSPVPMPPAADET